jgi:hypothetical protein
MFNQNQEKQRPLADWLGFKVQYHGHLLNWEELPSGETRYLYSPIKIVPWKHIHGDRPVRRIDHLWLYLEGGVQDINRQNRELIKGKGKNVNKPLTRLDQMIGCGYVVRYQRLDGSFDYGVKHTPSIVLSHALVAIRRSTPRSRPKNIQEVQKPLGVLRSTIEYIDSGLVLSGFNADLRKVRSELGEMLKVYEDELKIQQDAIDRLCRKQEKSSILEITYPHSERKPKKTLGFSQSKK